MIKLNELSAVALKAWTKKRVDDFLASRLAKDIHESKDLFALSCDCEYIGYDEQKHKHEITAGRYGATVNRKVDYLFANLPTCEKQAELEKQTELLRMTAEYVYLRGSALWVVENKEPAIMTDAIVFYTDITRQEILCVCRKVVDITVAVDTGAESTRYIYEIYFDGKRHRFTYDELPSKDSKDDKPEAMAVDFIEIKKCGDVPLFTRCKGILRALERIARHQDNNVENNTTPLTEIRGYEGTDVDELAVTIARTKIAMTSGTGGVAIHTRSMDSSSIQIWSEILNRLYYEVTATVGKDTELQYAQSGKALERLFVDMDNDAKKMAALLENAFNEYLVIKGEKEVDILWNTDKPYDDASVINSIMQSRGFVSDETLLERHPYVLNVEEEKKRIAEQQTMGLGDLGDMNGITDDDELKI